MTDEQRRSLRERADTIRDTLEDALPSRVTLRAGRRNRSLLDLDVFRMGREILAEMQIPRNDGLVSPANNALRSALLCFGEGVHEFEPAAKIAALRTSRRHLSHAVSHLLLVKDPPDDPIRGWIERLETEVLPALSGYIRWSEQLQRKR